MIASVMDLRYKMKEILAALDRNETVTITYRGKERAKMVPIEQPKQERSSVFDHPAFGMWKDREDMKDVEAWLRQRRQSRYHDL